MSRNTTLLNIKAVVARTGMCRTSVYTLLGKGRFPRPVYPTPNAPRWPSDEIDTWIESLRESRPTA